MKFNMQFIKKNILFIITGIFLIFLFKEGIFSNKFLFGSDTITLDYVFRSFSKDMFYKYHSLPVWLPYLFLGIPLLASSNLIYFYPTNLLFMVLPIPLYITYTYDIIIHIIIAITGMFLFLKLLKLNKESAFFGSIVYGFSGIIISFVSPGHWGNIKAASLIPFIFYFTHRGFKEKRIFFLLTAGLFLGLQIISIGMQIMAYTFLGIFLYVLYLFCENKKYKENIKDFILYFFILTISIILFGALQFFPSLTYVKYSWRQIFTYDDFISWSFNPYEVITFLLPNFFGLHGNTYWGNWQFNLTTFYFGLIPVFLLPFLTLLKSNKKIVLFFIIFSMLFLLLSFGGYTPFYKIFYYLPVFKNFRNPARFLYLFTFGMSVLSTIALNNILLYHDKKKLLKLLITGLFSFLIIFLFLYIFSNTDNILSLYKKFHGRKMNTKMLIFIKNLINTDLKVFIGMLFLMYFILYLFIRNKIKNVITIVLLLSIIHFMDIYRIEESFISYIDPSIVLNLNTPIKKVLEKDKTIFRCLNSQGTLGFINKNILLKIEMLNGYHGLLPKDYAELSIKNNLFKYINLNRLFNVKYYITTYEVKGLRKIYDNNIKIFVDDFFKPRVYLTDKVKIFNKKEDILKEFKTGNIDINTAYFIDNINLNNTDIFLKSNIDILEYKPSKIKLLINTNKESILVLSNMYYPEWKAKINNKLTKIYNVNYAVMGIKIPKGKNIVEFYYSRKKIYLSFILTILMFLIYIYTYIFEKRKKVYENFNSNSHI